MHTKDNGPTKKSTLTLISATLTTTTNMSTGTQLSTQSHKSIHATSVACKKSNVQSESHRGGVIAIFESASNHPKFQIEKSHQPVHAEIHGCPALSNRMTAYGRQVRNVCTRAKFYEAIQEFALMHQHIFSSSGTEH